MFVKQSGAPEVAAAKEVPTSKLGTRTVSFMPRFDEVETTKGQEKVQPICNLVCGTSSCVKALKKGKCPGEATDDNLLTCVTFRYFEGGQVCRAAGGTVRQMAF